jgi:hypothetical protein
MKGELHFSYNINKTKKTTAVIGVHEDEQHDETEIYKEMDKEFIQKWLRGTTTITTTRRRKY